MNLFRNFKSVTRTCYGRGTFAKLGDILEPHRLPHEGPAPDVERGTFLVFVVDHYFEDKTEFIRRIPAGPDDELVFIDSRE